MPQQPQPETTYSGDSTQDNTYPLCCIISANGTVWKLRINDAGILTTEEAS